jgi:hypothetical protein
VWNGITYPIIYGYANDWVPDYQGNSWTYTTVTATDGSVLLSRHQPRRGCPGRGGETSGARVTGFSTASAGRPRTGHRNR